MHEQIIYFGAPGTGKSHLIKDSLKTIPQKQIIRITIHPEYSYSDFVGQILPVLDSTGKNVEFKFKEGPFVEALKEAFKDSSKEVYLVLEEISRGNIAAIFGDIFQLLDRDEHFESVFKIRNKEIEAKVPQLASGSGVYLPSNLNILCTVNTNDQSVYPMDTAFKRRFDWVFVSPKPKKANSTDATYKLNNPKLIINSDSMGKIETNWLSFYCALNSFITNKYTGLGLKEDKQVGQFFLKFREKTVVDSYSTTPSVSNVALNDVASLIKNKLLIYLWQDVQPSGLFDNGTSLFAKGIADFDDLYYGYDTAQVFSDEFLSDLKAAASKYPY